MDEKNKQIQAKTDIIIELENKNTEYMRKIDELNTALRTAKKKTQTDGKDLLDKLKARDSEVEVLKEMVRGTKLQLKSKDTDIQRLTIKIKRLEKTNEIREDMINSIALNIKNGKDIDPGLLMQPTKAPRAADSRPSPIRKGSELF
jgi:chromosome segregation ATPase